jgi:MGT family glycosyltransferase
LVLHAIDPVFDSVPVELPPNHHYVGPLLWEVPGKRLPYLDEPGASWVLVTVSSALQDTEIQLAKVALSALAQQPLRVVLTVPSERLQQESRPVPQKARVKGYVPHSEVLKQRQMCIGHAGHGSVMKALYSGVLMVLVPWGWDQPGVAERAVKGGAANVLQRDELTARNLRAAISKVLHDPSMWIMHANHRSGFKRKTRWPRPVIMSNGWDEINSDRAIR